MKFILLSFLVCYSNPKKSPDFEGRCSIEEKKYVKASTITSFSDDVSVVCKMKKSSVISYDSMFDCYKKDTCRVDFERTGNLKLVYSACSHLQQELNK